MTLDANLWQAREAAKGKMTSIIAFLLEKKEKGEGETEKKNGKFFRNNE